MFEFSVACKYLLPKRKQLSVSLIALLSVGVIALVVWLVVVFFSVTSGLEKSWIQKLTLLTSPVRVTPKETYYRSYYHRVDALSQASEYRSKSLQEKLISLVSDPYDPEQDEEIPSFWPEKDLDPQGQLKDLVKLAYQGIEEVGQEIPLEKSFFQLLPSQIQLNLPRSSTAFSEEEAPSNAALSYPVVVSSLANQQKAVAATLLAPSPEDVRNLLLLSFSEGSSPSSFFSHVEISSLKTTGVEWLIPLYWLKKGKSYSGYAREEAGQIRHLFVTNHHAAEEASFMQAQKAAQTPLIPVQIRREKEWLVVTTSQRELLFSHRIPLSLMGSLELQAQLLKEHLSEARSAEDLRFLVSGTIQGHPFEAQVPFKNLLPSSFQARSPFFWVEKNLVFTELPRVWGEGVVLPKAFREAGVLLGDRGFLTFLSSAPSGMQERQIPIFVSGFYDPGILPTGGKWLFVNESLAQLLFSQLPGEEMASLTNGIHLRFDELEKAPWVKERLQQAFTRLGIGPYWNVETFSEFTFAKPLLLELKSQKNLFSLIAIVMLLVACSNIISLLLILVKDKRREMAILRSMGASKTSIALIFALVGGAVGSISSVLGIGAAFFTLRHIHTLVGAMSRWQGHEMLSPVFYGDLLPQEMSGEAFWFVVGATALFSTLAACIPAIQACRLCPSEALKEGGAG